MAETYLARRKTVARFDKILSRQDAAAITADGAVTNPGHDKTFFVTKAGVAAMTLAAPTAGTHDGVTLTFIAATANAHTLTIANGLSGAGASADVGTFGGAVGDRVVLRAWNGVWYPVINVNVTFA